MTRKVKAPPRLDYAPVLGETKNLSFGVIQADPDGETTAESTIGRRLFPVLRPVTFSARWPTPTCEKVEVLLPRGASDELWDPQRLAQAYDRQCFGSIRDLVINVTIRFPELDEIPQRLRLHEVWQLTCGFAAHMATEHQVAVVLALHVPARAARPGPAHVHLLIPARLLLPTGFGKFAQPLASDEDRAIVETAWDLWRTRSAGPDKVP